MNSISYSRHHLILLLLFYAFLCFQLFNVVASNVVVEFYCCMCSVEHETLEKMVVVLEEEN